jgi:hypothetical protein
MTQSVEEARRKLFEDKIVTHWPGARFHYRRDALPKSDPLYNTYVEQCLHDAWIGFNAALDAMEIPLKSPYMDYSYSDSEITGACKQYDRCRAAIEKTGLGLRIK